MKTIIIIGAYFIFSASFAFTQPIQTANFKTVLKQQVTNLEAMPSDIDPPVYPKPPFPPKP